MSVPEERLPEVHEIVVAPSASTSPPVANPITFVPEPTPAAPLSAQATRLVAGPLAEQLGNEVSGAHQEAPVPWQELAVVAILNDGGLDDLKTLKGLGPASAKKILEYRRAGNQIHRLEDLVKHVGLSKTIMAKVSQNV